MRKTPQTPGGEGMEVCLDANSRQNLAAAAVRPLLRAGFIRMPGNIHMLLRDPGGRHQLSADLSAWMVTRGDAWGDHL